jgi:cell division transport system permease protein
MNHSEEQYHRHRLKTAYVSTVVSISLVLFMLGLVCLIMLDAKKLSDYFKENIIVRVIMKENVQESQILTLQQKLSTADYVKTIQYITREKAAADLQKDLGDDFISLLGYNPLLPSLEIHLKADFANDQSFQKIETDLRNNQDVKEVYYHKTLVSLVNENIKKISVFILGFSLLLFIIAFALINNTIRLAVYSKRFLIKSMQLVGATQGFIRRPFMIQGLVQGVIGSVITIGLLALTLFFTGKENPDLANLQDTKLTLLLYAIVFVLGLLISWISTFFAVRKYLRIKTDYLYFY